MSYSHTYSILECWVISNPKVIFRGPLLKIMLTPWKLWNLFMIKSCIALPCQTFNFSNFSNFNLFQFSKSKKTKLNIVFIVQILQKLFKLTANTFRIMKNKGFDRILLYLICVYFTAKSWLFLLGYQSSYHELTLVTNKVFISMLLCLINLNELTMARVSFFASAAVFVTSAAIFPCTTSLWSEEYFLRSSIVPDLKAILYPLWLNAVFYRPSAH